jgi:hypothetical protein
LYLLAKSDIKFQDKKSDVTAISLFTMLLAEDVMNKINSTTKAITKVQNELQPILSIIEDEKSKINEKELEALIRTLGATGVTAAAGILAIVLAATGTGDIFIPLAVDAIVWGVREAIQGIRELLKLNGTQVPRPDLPSKFYLQVP